MPDTNQKGISGWGPSPSVVCESPGLGYPAVGVGCGRRADRQVYFNGIGRTYTMCGSCADFVIRGGYGAEYLRAGDKVRDFFLNGWGSLIAAIVISGAALFAAHLINTAWNSF
jgi:hypothetical protein